MKKIPGRKSIQTKITGIVLLATFLVTVALGSLAFSFSRSRLIFMLGESIRGIAATTSTFIDPAELLLILSNVKGIKEKYFAPGSNLPYRAEGRAESLAEGRAESQVSKAVENYAKYTALLNRIREVNTIPSPINVYVRDSNRLKLILSSDRGVLIGSQYSMRREAKEAFERNLPISTGIYADKDGIWISAFAPIRLDPPNVALGLIEINYKIGLYLAKLRGELALIFLVCLMGFFAAAILSYKLISRLVAAIRRLDEAAINLEKENYNIRIEARSDDEIGSLAQTFEKLRLSIRKKIEELKLSLMKEKRAHLESIVTLTNAIDLRDPYIRKHLYRVDKYALLIARAMRLPKADIEKLRYSCYLHDIGKINVEYDLLQKAKLSEAEIKRIKKHAEDGAKIIEGVPFLYDVKDIILCHQERYDGKGYPNGLKGDEIPPLARILTLADAFDAITTDRPYKKKVGFGEAMAIVEKESGAQFDPEACKALLKYRDTIEKIAKKHF